ncbi:MAG: DUF1178 family protein [Polaromonas sp.]
MKVLDLQCGQRHSFEGWFGSEEDFQSQLVRGLVECPMCADKAVVKMPSAPRLNFGGHTPPSSPAETASSSSKSGTEVAVSDASPSTELTTTADQPVQSSPSPEQQAAFLNAVRHVLANTEDVGDKFANQARAMHYGDAEPRSIRGQATQREAVELIEEGIDVMALPMPAALKETLQ